MCILYNTYGLYKYILGKVLQTKMVNATGGVGLGRGRVVKVKNKVNMHNILGQKKYVALFPEDLVAKKFDPGGRKKKFCTQMEIQMKKENKH